MRVPQSLIIIKIKTNVRLVYNYTNSKINPLRVTQITTEHMNVICKL